MSLLIIVMAGLAALPCCAAADTVASQPYARIVTSYSLISANDHFERDPRSWRLSGSSNGGKTWVTLDCRKGVVFSERFQKQHFAITNQLALSLFRLEVDEVNNPGTANSIQLGEIELHGARRGQSLDEEHRLAADIVAASGDNPPGESADKAFDGMRTTKWLAFVKTPSAQTNFGWVQWQYRMASPATMTNLSSLGQLTETRLKAALPVHFDAVVLGRDRKSGGLYLSDLTNVFTLLNPPSPPTGLRGNRSL